MDVTGDGSKVRWRKQQYRIGTWNVRSMNQGKLEVVKQELARVNVDILGMSRNADSRNQQTQMDWNAKVRSQEVPGVTGRFGLGVQNETG